MEEPEITLPDNVAALFEKAQAAIEAKKAELRGSRELTQQKLVNAQMQAESAGIKLREIAAEETKHRKEAEELERRVERKRQDELEEARLIELEEARREKKRNTQPESQPSFTKRSRNITSDDAERMQRVQDLAKERGDTIKFGDEDEDNDEENMDAISPFSLMALSPKGACDMYQKVRLNTIRVMMSAINRRLAKAVATKEIITVKEKKVRPNDRIDTLCVFTDEMREDLMKLYEQKGWKVTLKGEESKKITYVFQPQSA